MSCLYGNILGTFHSSPILPVFQFQKFPAKAAKPGQTGLSKAFEFVFKGQDRISTLTRAAGEPALEESERKSRSPPSALRRRERGERPPPSTRGRPPGATPRRQGKSIGENSLTSRSSAPTVCRGRGVLEPRPYANVEVLLLRWRTFPPRDTSYADGLLSPFDDRPRWDAVTVGLDVDHER